MRRCAAGVPREVGAMRNIRISLVLGAALSVAVLVGLPTEGRAEVTVSITIAPPVLPVYVQPAIPGEGYIWAPGYWAYGPDGYFWVPGTWVLPPMVGLLWTPGYWGWGGGAYFWHDGYWGPHIGFYGGVNYGFGYVGHGYEGGYWRDNRFYYNTAVNNVNATNVQNTYTRTVVNNVTVNNVSYNGGSGGVSAQPNREEMAAAQERHVAPTPVQRSHVEAASGNRSLLASVNHGRPAIAASARPGDFSARSTVGARAPGPRPAPAQRAANGAASGNAAPHAWQAPGAVTHRPAVDYQTRPMQPPAERAPRPAPPPARAAERPPPGAGAPPPARRPPARAPEGEREPHPHR